MTTIKQVEFVLLQLIDEENETARRWISNDIIKMKLADSYDAWMDDVDDHECPLTLREHIESCIDIPEYIGNPPS